MIRGFVNAKLEAVIRLTVAGAHVEHESDTVIDTGYNGFLTLPLAIIRRLDLTYFGSGRVELGDGRLEVFDMYLGAIGWDGQPKTIVVDAAETAPLAGTALLAGHDLFARFVPDGDVTITPV